jgi:small-conductance mechanosensitive channel/CRP-like cAMP-binding protein
MEFLKDLTGSLFWAFLLSLGIYAACSYALKFLSKKSKLLEPISMGLNLIALFVSLQVFLNLGASEYYPRLSKQINFLSWLIFAFAALRLGLYTYGDLFVVRWKRGSFPAAFKNIITFFVIIVVALILLKEILDINVTSLIATTTVLTATIGLAFQSTLANMLAGLSIHLEKSLNQGDWISVGGQEGRVIDISLRSTQIMTIDHNEVFIPNSKVLNDAVVNYSLPSTVQVRKLAVGVSYSIAPNKVRRTIREILDAVPDVSRYPEPVVRVMSYGDFSIQYEMRYAITDHAKYVDIETEIMNLIWYRFRRNNIEIPMPVRNINMTQVTTESRLAQKEKTSQELINLMRKVVILSPLSQEELAALVQQVRIVPFAAGEVPIQQGDPGDSFYIIKNGRVDVIVTKASGDAAVVASLGPGNFFGEMSLLTGAARTASIHVVEDAEFIVIDKESFAATLAGNPSIAESLSHILSERQAGLSAEHERLDPAAMERRKRDASGRMLSKIREFFGLIE